MTQPRLSVVIPTYNRKERLARVLCALDSQSVAPSEFDVVVVDDGSSDGTAAWLAESRFGFTLDALCQDNAGPARARNAGVRAARGELVLFLDDDVVPEPELLEEHLRSHAEDDKSLVVIGPLASLPSYSQPWVAWEQAKIEKQYAAMMRGDWSPTYRQFWTGNASVGRRHLIDAGLFDPSLLRGEDVELGFRLHQRGLEFRFNPLARGMHHAERSLSSWETAHASYGRLEVDIFSQTGEEDLHRILMQNLRTLNPATRRVVLASVDDERRHDVLCRLLRAFLTSPVANRAPRASGMACSVFANLLYWRAARQALGAERMAEIVRRVAEAR